MAAGGSRTRPARPAAGVVQINNYPIGTLGLNADAGCNLSCSYCCKEDLATPDQGQKMASETAAKSFELLLRPELRRADTDPIKI